MEFDPHTIQQILTHVRDQLRCPQCRKRVEVTLETLRVLGETFAVMQLRCRVCSAYIMLHATLRPLRSRNGRDSGGTDRAFSMNAVTLPSPPGRPSRRGRAAREAGMDLKEKTAPGGQKGKNASTELQVDPEEMKKLRKELMDAGGSFMELFEGDET